MKDPDARRRPGVLAATQPEDRFQYVAVYEFESEETLHRFLASEHFAFLQQSDGAAGPARGCRTAASSISTGRRGERWSGRQAARVC